VVSKQKLFVFIFNEAGEHASTEMDGNEGTLTWKPCETHQNGHRPCKPKNCKNGKWVRVESKRTACDDCVKSRKKCTHGLAGKVEAPVTREPDLSTFQKPAGKTKRAQEMPVLSVAPEKPDSGGKTKRAKEAPVLSVAPEKSGLGGKTKRAKEAPVSNADPYDIPPGFGMLYTLSHPEGKMIAFDEIKDPKVLYYMKSYGAYQEPDLVEKYNREMQATLQAEFNEVFRKRQLADDLLKRESAVTGPSVEAKVQKEALDLDNLSTREWEVMFFDEQDVPVDRDLR
jgi:hypothetical protein